MTDEAYAAKKELLRYHQAKRGIEDMKDKIEAKRAELDAVCKPLQDVKIQRTSFENSRERMMDSFMELQEKYCDMQTSAEQLCFAIENSISLIECEYGDLYRRILRNHYLYNQTLEKISVDENYSYKSIRRMHYRALEEYYWIIKDVHQCPLCM